MKKSVYSLVLTDDVVEAIDEMAYRLGTSRSSLINQILAEKVSYITPEQRMKNIFQCIRNMMDSHFMIQGQSSEAMLSMRSPLRFKYKPTIRYRVELLREMHDSTFGYLTVSFRTQSIQLMKALESFFGIWSAIENRYSGRKFRNGVEYSFSDGKFIRSLKLIDDIHYDNEKLGQWVSELIGYIDSAIKIYFADMDIPEEAIKKIDSFYSDHSDSIYV